MGGSGLDLIKPWAVSPLRRTIGQHLDAFQIIDGTALSDSDVDHAIGLQADCNSGMQGFFGGSAGGSNKNTNLRIRYPFMGVWAITGMSLDSNGGASELLGPVMMKVNSGDEDSFPAPAGARFETIGPNLIFSAASAGNWAGTLTVVGGRIGDQTQILTAYPTPTYSPAPTDLARATDTTFVVGDARAVLEAADWAAMSKATLQAFTKDTLRHASAGPIDAAGNYRDLAPTFDATATTFDSSTLTWDHA
jgi:hypothetical protein